MKYTPLTETPACLLFHLISLCHLNSSDLSGHLRVSVLPGTRKLAIDALDPVWCLCCVHDSVTSHESTTELGSGHFRRWDCLCAAAAGGCRECIHSAVIWHMQRNVRLK